MNSKPKPTTKIVDWHTAEAAARISGLSLDMVNYLCRNKIIEPSGSKDRGRGVVRKYVYTDVLVLRVVAKLLDQHVSVLKLKKCLVALQRRSGNASALLSKKFLATNGHEVYFADRNTLQLLDSGQMAFAFVMELCSVRKEVDAGIKRWGRVA